MQRKLKKLFKLLKTPKKLLEKVKIYTINRRFNQKNYDLILRTKSIEKNINLKNLEEVFDIKYIIKNLNKLNIQALYIKPIEENLKWAICIKSSEKENFFNQFMYFIYYEGINIEYTYKKERKQAKSIKEFWFDISLLKAVDIRLDTLRTKDKPLWFRLEIWEEYEEFYLSPRANYISRKLWKSTAKKHNIFIDDSLIDYSVILEHSHEGKITFDIDLVFTWVNSEDEEWQKMYQKYKPSLNTDATSTSRFLSRDELKYALRSWDKYGKFIRNIYIVSNCKPPKWLDLTQSNLYWVYHEEIMPIEVLPTFSSHAIETSLHKIKGLSNYFIYSNDDFLLLKPMTGNDFFYSNGIAKLRLEPYGNVNGEVKEGDADYLNAARNSNKLLEIDFKKTTTQLHTHSPQSMRVDILNRMEEQYLDAFNITMKNKFRKYTDIAVTGYLYHHFALLSGNALQTNIKTELVQQNHDFKKKLQLLITLKKQENWEKLPLSVCLNDGADSHLNRNWNIEIMKFLNSFFLDASKYENKL